VLVQQLCLLVLVGLATVVALLVAMRRLCLLADSSSSHSSTTTSNWQAPQAQQLNAATTAAKSAQLLECMAAEAKWQSLPLVEDCVPSLRQLLQCSKPWQLLEQ
jgi:hypothetical protein